MNNMMLNFVLDQMKHRCIIKDDDYWKLELKNGDTFTHSDATTLLFRTKEGFTIRIFYINWGIGPTYFNGYVSIPSTPEFTHLISWINDNPHYDDLTENLRLKVQLTFKEGLEYGWDHAHGWDADLGKPLAFQVHKQASGPIQVYDEARGVIESMIKFNNELLRQKSS